MNRHLKGMDKKQYVFYLYLLYTYKDGMRARVSKLELPLGY